MKINLRNKENNLPLTDITRLAPVLSERLGRTELELEPEDAELENKSISMQRLQWASRQMHKGKRVWKMGIGALRKI